jgi:hypothetical protein
VGSKVVSLSPSSTNWFIHTRQQRTKNVSKCIAFSFKDLIFIGFCERYDKKDGDGEVCESVHVACAFGMCCRCWVWI